MERFRKKPVVIEAVQWTGNNHDEILAFMGKPAEGLGYQHYLTIGTFEGDHRADVGDWIIKGVKGEFYPCKPDIFDITYEPESTPERSLQKPKLTPHAVDTIRNLAFECYLPLEGFIERLKDFGVEVDPKLTGWQPIATAPLGQLSLLWGPLWRHPFPGKRVSDTQSWVDTCEAEARGRVCFATHWQPLPDPPRDPQTTPEGSLGTPEVEK